MIKRLFIDLETTGTNYKIHGVHQIAGIIDLDGKEVDRFDLKVRPHPRAKIEPEALNVCGVDEMDLLGYPPMEDVHRELKGILDLYVDKWDKTDKFFMAGFNINYFDNPFLYMWWRLCGDNFIGSYFFTGNLDVMTLAAQALIHERPGMPSFKLHRVARTMGIEVEKDRLHDAMYDVELTRAIYYKTIIQNNSQNNDLF